MDTPRIATAIPGTVKAWFNPPAHFEGAPLPPGPWSDEPNKMQWVDAETGLPCLIVRGGSGSLCGYVGVAPTHQFHGRDYEHVNVEVHGGLSFSAGCQHSEDESYGVCHVPEPGTSDNVWWFGFDCAHFLDLSPAMLRHNCNFQRNDVYRDVGYVAREVTSLAAQLATLDATAALQENS